MSTQPSGGKYEVTVWDYDGAPDASDFLNPDDDPDSIAPYYVRGRSRFDTFFQAREYARTQVEEKRRVGAAVFHANKVLVGFGLTFEPKSAES